MELPKTITSAKLVADFVLEVKFNPGGVRFVDFRDLPLGGAFKKIGLNTSYFRTMYVKDGYLMWGGDLTIDSDFVFEHSKPAYQATGFVARVLRPLAKS